MQGYNYLTLIDVVEKTFQKFPNHIALVQEDNGTEVDYKTLQVYVNTLTKSLQSFINSIAPNAVSNPQDTPLVSLMTQRSIGTIVAILSILKSGAAYVPVDPTFPPDRQAHIFNHSKSLLLIVDEHTFDQVKLFDVDIPPILVIDSKTGTITRNVSDLQSSSLPPIHQPNPHNLAYVLYTSGSTGKPKGVMVINHSVVNIVDFFARDIGATDQDAVLGLTTLCFDISVLETFLPLFVGGRLVIASSAAQKNPYRIVEVLDQHRVTVMQATPTTYEMLFAVGWTGNKKITFLVGGEACRPSVTKLTTNSAALLNVYGPTETTIWSTWFRFPPGAMGRFPEGSRRQSDFSDEFVLGE